MPEITPINIHVEGKDKTVFDYVAKVYVTSEGTFRVNLDMRLTGIAAKLRTGGIGLDCARGIWKISGKALSDIRKFIEACATEYLRCEVVTTRVIVYGHSVNVAVWIHDGKLYPNGSRREGSWFKPSKNGTISATRRVPYYSIGIAAAVFDKTVYKRASGDRAVYTHVHQEEDEVIAQLNSFCGLNIDPESDDYTEMPYTAEAAVFFYNMMLKLCQTAIELDNFLGDKHRLELAIKENLFLGGAPLLLK